MTSSALNREIERLATKAAAIIRDVVGEQAQVVWFGSWVQGTAVERSDIDLAVDAGRELEGRELLQIQDALEKLPTLRSLDVVDLQAIGQDQRAEIESGGRTL